MSCRSVAGNHDLPEIFRVEYTPGDNETGVELLYDSERDSFSPDPDGPFIFVNDLKSEGLDLSGYQGSRYTWTRTVTEPLNVNGLIVQPGDYVVSGTIGDILPGSKRRSYQRGSGCFLFIIDAFPQVQEQFAPAGRAGSFGLLGTLEIEHPTSVYNYTADRIDFPSISRHFYLFNGDAGNANPGFLDNSPLTVGETIGVAYLPGPGSVVSVDNVCSYFKVGDIMEFSSSVSTTADPILLQVNGHNGLTGQIGGIGAGPDSVALFEGEVLSGVHSSSREWFLTETSRHQVVKINPTTIFDFEEGAIANLDLSCNDNITDLQDQIDSLELGEGVKGDKGDQGDPGPMGNDGATGADGLSAYELAMQPTCYPGWNVPAFGGFASNPNSTIPAGAIQEGDTLTVGGEEVTVLGITVFDTEESSVITQVGFEIPIDGGTDLELCIPGFEGTLDEWLDSLNGEDGVIGMDGADGASAYEVYVDTTDDSPVLSETKWLQSLVGDTGDTGAAGTNGSQGRYNISVFQSFAVGDTIPATVTFNIGADGAITSDLGDWSLTPTSVANEDIYEGRYNFNPEDGAVTNAVFNVFRAGEAGPAGMNGIDGTNGTNGEDGEDGKDGEQGFYTVFININSATAPTVFGGDGIITPPTNGDGGLSWSFAQDFVDSGANPVYQSAAVFNPALPDAVLTWATPYLATGSTGPQGPAGPAGMDGINGTNGTNGTNGDNGVITAITADGTIEDGDSILVCKADGTYACVETADAGLAPEGGAVNVTDGGVEVGPVDIDNQGITVTGQSSRNGVVCDSVSGTFTLDQGTNATENGYLFYDENLSEILDNVDLSLNTTKLIQFSSVGDFSDIQKSIASVANITLPTAEDSTVFLAADGFTPVTLAFNQVEEEGYFAVTVTGVAIDRPHGTTYRMILGGTDLTINTTLTTDATDNTKVLGGLTADSFSISAGEFNGFQAADNGKNTNPRTGVWGVGCMTPAVGTIGSTVTTEISDTGIAVTDPDTTETVTVAADTVSVSSEEGEETLSTVVSSTGVTVSQGDDEVSISPTEVTVGDASITSDEISIEGDPVEGEERESTVVSSTGVTVSQGTTISQTDLDGFFITDGMTTTTVGPSSVSTGETVISDSGTVFSSDCIVEDASNAGYFIGGSTRDGFFDIVDLQVALAHQDEFVDGSEYFIERTDNDTSGIFVYNSSRGRLQEVSGDLEGLVSHFTGGQPESVVRICFPVEVTVNGQMDVVGDVSIGGDLTTGGLQLKDRFVVVPSGSTGDPIDGSIAPGTTGVLATFSGGVATTPGITFGNDVTESEIVDFVLNINASYNITRDNFIGAAYNGFSDIYSGVNITDGAVQISVVSGASGITVSVHDDNVWTGGVPMNLLPITGTGSIEQLACIPQGGQLQVGDSTTYITENYIYTTGDLYSDGGLVRLRNLPTYDGVDTVGSEELDEGIVKVDNFGQLYRAEEAGVDFESLSENTIPVVNSEGDALEDSAITQSPGEDGTVTTIGGHDIILSNTLLDTPSQDVGVSAAGGSGFSAARFLLHNTSFDNLRQSTAIDEWIPTEGEVPTSWDDVGGVDGITHVDGGGSLTYQPAVPFTGTVEQNQVGGALTQDSDLVIASTSSAFSGAVASGSAWSTVTYVHFNNTVSGSFWERTSNAAAADFVQGITTNSFILLYTDDSNWAVVSPISTTGVANSLNVSVEASMGVTPTIGNQITIGFVPSATYPFPSDEIRIAGDLNVTGNIVLTSPDGTQFELSVDNVGNLITKEL